MQTGGSLSDCCLDGCSCDFGVSVPVSSVLPYSVRQGSPPFGTRGGQLDWLKTLRVTVLRRIRRMPYNYRAWLNQGSSSPASFLTIDTDLAVNWFPRTDLPVSVNASIFAARLGAALGDGSGAITFNPDGSLLKSTLSGAGTLDSLNTYTQKISGPTICSGCLSGVPGSTIEGRSGNDLCNATLGDGETLSGVAPAYGTDWMSLYMLNGGTSPDDWTTGQSFRYAHEHLVRAGETLVSVAARYGTTVTDLVELNYNTITHIQNPIRVIARIQNPIRALCAHPSAQDASQAQWAPATGLPPCEAGHHPNVQSPTRGPRDAPRKGAHLA